MTICFLVSDFDEAMTDTDGHRPPVAVRQHGSPTGQPGWGRCQIEDIAEDL
jgi:hypothetical protein